MRITEYIAHSQDFQQRVDVRELRIGVVGLGSAGLPLALAFAEAGFSVTGIDLNAERVAAVNAGRSYLVDVHDERYTDAQGHLQATTDASVVSDLDALTICVPTPLSKTRSPGLTFVIAAAESTTGGQVVMLQSTTYPGTTEELVLPTLQRDGRVVGRDFFLGYAPERVDPGNVHYTVRILVLGVAYKPDVHDTRESPSLRIMQDLIARGADLRYCDPWVDVVAVGDAVHTSVAWSDEEVEAADCVVVLTPHRQFLDEPHWQTAHLIVDTRNAAPHADNVWRI